MRNEPHHVLVRSTGISGKSPCTRTVLQVPPPPAGLVSGIRGDGHPCERPHGEHRPVVSSDPRRRGSLSVWEGRVLKVLDGYTDIVDEGFVRGHKYVALFVHHIPEPEPVHPPSKLAPKAPTTLLAPRAKCTFARTTSPTKAGWPPEGAASNPRFLYVAGIHRGFSVPRGWSAQGIPGSGTGPPYSDSPWPGWCSGPIS